MHYKAFIEWFKYLTATVTLQHYSKLRIENHLRNIKLEPDEIDTLTTIDTSTITTVHLVIIKNVNKPTTTMTKINGRTPSFHPSTSPPNSFHLVTMKNISPSLYTLSLVSQIITIFSKHYYPTLPPSRLISTPNTVSSLYYMESSNTLSLQRIDNTFFSIINSYIN